MEEFVEEFFDSLDFPIIVTDESDLVIYKNPFAKKYIPVPRKGGSIVRYIDSGRINMLDESRLVSFSSLFGQSAPYKCALVFKSDDSAVPDLKLWIFDQSLFLLQRDHVRGFLSGVARTLAPTLIPLIRDDHKIKYLPRAAELGETLRALSGYFYKRSRELETASTFSKLLPVERLIDFLKSAILGPAEKFGCPILFRYERENNSPCYIDFSHYTLIFIRLFILAIERSVHKGADVLLRCDGSELSTLISFTPNLPKRYSPSGRFEEFRTTIPGNDINIAMLEALFEDESCRFSYETGPEKTYPLTVRFDMDLAAPPKRLAQDVDPDSTDLIAEEMRMIADLIAALIEK